MIKISVVVPVYNVYDYLEKCLKSIIRQSLKDIEIIVVNDGSPDDSYKIIDKYKKKYPDLIRSYEKKNGGQSSARNYGIKKARGEYIICIDSDDYIKPFMFKEMYNEAKSKKLDILVSNTIMKYDDHEYEIKSNLNYTDDVLKSYLIAYPMPPIRLVKREIMQNNLFVEGIIYEDLELIPTLMLVTDKIGFIDKSYYYYYQRQGSTMYATKFSEKLKDIFTVMESIEEKFKKHNKYDEYFEELEFLNITHLLRTSTLRFIEYDEAADCLEKINLIIKEKYPNFKNNKYFKKSSFKLKLICILAYNKNYRLLKLIKKVTNK